jgi:hypothetical protein
MPLDAPVTIARGLVSGDFCVAMIRSIYAD